MTGTARVLSGAATRLTVVVGEADQWRHRPLYAEIVHRAREAGLAGASVFRGVEGFGASALVHTARLLSLSEDLPVAVVIVDEDERVRGFLPRLEGLVDGGLVTLERCEVVRHGNGGADSGTGTGAGSGPGGPSGTGRGSGPGGPTGTGTGGGSAA